MSVTRKQSKFLDEYLIDFNATQAYIRAGYSENGARQNAYNLLHSTDIKAELARRLEENRMKPEEIVARIEKMAAGELPTKVVERPSNQYGKPTYHREYDTKGALQDLGKVYALFVDKQIVENIGLEIVDDNDPEVPGA